MIHTPRAARQLCALVLIVTTAACSGPAKAREGGPLSNSDESMKVCLPLAAGQSDAAWGVEVLANTGSEVLTLTGVSPIDPQGLRVSEAVIVSIAEKDDLFGAWSRWPPRSADQSPGAARWSGRRPVVGHQIKPGKQASENLVAHVVRDPSVSEATMRALRIDYTVGDQSYWIETNTSLALKPKCS
ncbi:hypothetical protein ACFTSF_15570 [Kribbella sp. NPDC056951]|uniref:hypothetical protein n=1 Tax=Kribbella sp. NPDC056951 TaxID=3345978 RepID=UPI0036278491